MLVWLALSIANWPEHQKIFLARLPAAVDAFEAKHGEELKETVFKAIFGKGN